MKYYEPGPNDTMFVVPMIRSLREVIFERELIAEHFKDSLVLGGTCDLFKTQIHLEEQGIQFSELETPVSLELQEMVDVYNKITAKEIIKKYKEAAP